MIIVKRVLCDVVCENCYIVFDDVNHDGLIIDPGSNYNDIVKIVTENNINIKGILLTHGHFDHTMSCYKLQQDGYKVYISENDAYMCKGEEFNFAKENNIPFVPFIPDVVISSQDEQIKIGNIEVKILHVSGHSKGGLAYCIDKYLFSGDTLFQHGYGRTDLNGGNFREMLTSIKLLRTYTKKGYILLAGHNY